jgi:putative ABC transport system permease protein
MKTQKVFKTAFTSLWVNPMRTILTLLGIIIGVAAVITLMSVGSATTSSVTSRIQGLGTNLLVITPGQATQNGVSQGLGSSNSLTQSDVAELQKLPELSAVAPDALTRVQIVYGSNNYQTQAEGSTPDLFFIRNLQLASGRPFNLVEEQNRATVVVLGATAAENIFGYQNAVGKTVWINGIPFQVIGVLASQGSSGPTNNDDRVLMPISTLQSRFTGSTNPSVIYASAVNGNEMTTAQQQVELTLRQSHGLSFGTQDDFVITNQSTLLDTLQGVTQTLQSFLGGIAGISLLVGGIGIMNIMLVSVTERTREIGLRKALGATKGAVLQQFIVESGMVGLLGGVIGIIFGWIGAMVVGRMMQTAVQVNILSVWLAFAVSLIVGVVFGIYPAFRAASLSPINALRYE